MGAIFQSLGRTIIAGVVLLVILIILAGLGTGSWVRFGDHAWWAFFMRWLHVLSGVMWIGLLWYFNFVQTPSMPKIPDEQKPAIGKVIAPTALFWFRWAAMATIITGLIVALMQGLARSRRSRCRRATTRSASACGSARSCAFNVWFIIWPNQKKALGIVTVTPEEKAARGADGGHDFPLQHHAVDPDALLHGGAAERRAVTMK